MHRTLIMTAVVASSLLVACGGYGTDTNEPVAAGAKAAAFSLNAVGADGATKALANDSLANPTALVFMSTSCPYCEDYAGRLTELAKGYGDKGVDFVFVYPNRKESDEDKAKHHKDTNLGGMFANDTEATVAKALGIRKTPEVVILSKSGELLFQGGIDDDARGKDIEKRFVATALDEHLAGKPVTTTSAPAPG